MMKEQKKRSSRTEVRATGPDDQTEVRCPNCDYFLIETIEVEGRTIFKMVCRSCRNRLLLKVTPEEILVGQL